jgi:hypothetical protein
MTPRLTVTTALPPHGREEAVLRVAAQYEPAVLRIVASVPAPDFHRPLALHRFLLRRERTLQRLEHAAAVAISLVGPETVIETQLVRGSLADFLASGADQAQVLVVPLRPTESPATQCTHTHDGRMVVAVAEPQLVEPQMATSR